ncbi:hypothetical protein MTQ16_04420 [Corynebacterium bovis]|uniref:hypothetical protein n=1 Tax=Corynebacterium bovis TaxID=36808 RepID=UPI0031396179
MAQRTPTRGTALAAVTVTALAAVVAVTVADAPDDTTTGPGRGISRDLTGGDAQVRAGLAGRMAQEDYLAPGDEVTVTTGGDRYTVSVDGLRVVDAYAADGSPARHSSLACVDVTVRGPGPASTPTGDALAGERPDLAAVIDGRYTLPLRDGATVPVPPGWSGTATYGPDGRYTVDAAFAGPRTTTDGNGVTSSTCTEITLTSRPDAPGSPLSDGEPSDVTGYTVTLRSLRTADTGDTDPAFATDENPRGKSGWRLNH